MTATTYDEMSIRARIPADLDTPDKLLAGLTARQLSLLAPVAIGLYIAWRALAGQIPAVLLLAVLTPVAGLALTIAVGRRDGTSLDAWLAAAAAHAMRPRRLAPTPPGGTPTGPDWAPSTSSPDPSRRTPRRPGRRKDRRGQGAPPRPGLLRLPADAISSSGVITSGGTSVVLVAASTVTAGLHTPAEEAALMAGYARWLNSLAGPVQIVVSARRAGIGDRALHVAETAAHLPHPVLARAAIDHAGYLLDLCEDGDPLTRAVTIACTAPGAPAPATNSGNVGGAGPRGRAGAGGEALRRAERTAAALSVTGSRCRVLDGGDVTAVLAAATDPFGPADASWPRTPPGAPVTSTAVQFDAGAIRPSRDNVRDDASRPADPDHDGIGRGDDPDWDEQDWDDDPPGSDGWDGDAEVQPRGRWSR